MSKTIIQIADELIPPANGKIVLKKNGATQDIIAEVLAAFRDARTQLCKFAPHLKAATLQQTLYNVWDFWKHNVKYQVDPENKQLVQEPQAFWAQPRQGDCKSFSVAVMATLYCLNIEAAFRFASYAKIEAKTPEEYQEAYMNLFPTHVYVVALVNGKEIPVDCVWKEFGTQKKFTKNWDYNMDTAIYRVSGFGDAPAGPKVYRRKGGIENGLRPVATAGAGKPVFASFRKGGGNMKPLPTNNTTPVKKPRHKRGELHIPLHNPRITGDHIDLLLDKQFLELQQIHNAKINGIGSDTDNALELQIVAHHNALAPVMGWKEKHFVDIAPTMAPEFREGVGFLGLGKKAQAKKLAKAKADNTAGKAVSKRMAKKLKKVGVTATKIKDGLLKRIGKGIVKVLATPVRLALMATLPKMGPFFLYTFIVDPNVISRLPNAVVIKRNKALKFKSIIVDKLQMKESNFEKSVRNGIMSQLGKTPEQVIAEWMTTSGFKIGFITAALSTALPLVKGLFQKLTGQAAADIENSQPAPEDWGIATDEQKQTLSQGVLNQPGNAPLFSMDQLHQAADAAGYTTGGSFNQDAGGSPDIFANRGNSADDATGDTSLNDVKTEEGVTVTAGKKDNTMIYLGLGLGALLLMSKKGKH